MLIPQDIADAFSASHRERVLAMNNGTVKVLASFLNKDRGQACIVVECSCTRPECTGTGLIVDDISRGTAHFAVTPETAVGIATALMKQAAS